MQEYFEIDAYKHLLSVTQNLLYSLQIDQQMLKKYQSLKQAILDRINPQPNQTTRLLSAYKDVLTHTLRVLGEWQAQLEGYMQRTNYNEKVLEINKQIDGILKNLQHYNNTTINNPKLHLQFQEQIDSLRYLHDQLDNKFENMGLTIEVHQKMHEIICEAGKNQTNRLNKENQYKAKIRSLMQQNREINDCKEFIAQHSISEQNLRNYHIAKNKLTLILFDKQ